MTNQYSRAKLVFKPVYLLYKYQTLLQQSGVWYFNEPSAFVGIFHLASYKENYLDFYHVITLSS